MKKILLFVTLCGVMSVLSCGKGETSAEGDALTRGAGIMNDSATSDLGKVRIGDVVIDTTWNKETNINF